MTIRFKILMGCFALTVLTAAVGLFARAVEAQLGSLSIALYDEAFQAMSYLRSAQNGALVAAGMPPAEASQRIKEALSDIAIAEQRALSPAGRSASARLGAMLHKLADSPSGDPALFSSIQDAFDTAVEIYAADGYHVRRAAGEALVSTGRTTWWLIGTAVACGLLIATLLTRSVLPPIRQAVAIAQSIAAGRFDNPIDARGASETASLLRALGSMQAAIARARAENRGLLERLRIEHAAQGAHHDDFGALARCFGSSLGGVFRIVHGASVGMAQTAGGLLQDSAALLDASADVHVQIEQVVARIDAASQSSHALTEAILNIRGQTALTEQRARSALDETEAALALMAGLSLAAGKIGSIADVIGRLAAQTRLLALNASIESARAGPAGAGFAVVATEVKRLADSSAEAAQVVARHVGSVQSAADGVRTSMGAINTSNEDVYRRSVAIAQAVAAQDTASAAMSVSLSDILANTAKVRQSLATADELTHAGAQNLRGLAGSANTLSANAADLSQEVSVFLALMRDIRPGELAGGPLITAPAVLVVEGAPLQGEAVFRSEFAVCFRPAVEYPVGASGALHVAGARTVIPVRIAETDAAGTHLQPLFEAAQRARVRAVLAGVANQVGAE